MLGEEMSKSYWIDKEQLKIKEPSQNNQEEKNYDIVVIGGGVAGVSTAYWLKKTDPSLKVAILEKAPYLSQGASGRNAGFITCGSVEHFNRMVENYGKEKALNIWRYSEENLKLLKEHIIKDNGPALDFKQSGTFSLASDDKEFSELKKVAALMDEENIGVEVLNSSDIEKRVGAINFVGGIKYLEDAEVHPVKLVEQIYKTLPEDVDIYLNTEVSSIDNVGDSRTCYTNNGTFNSMAVVMATNGYSALLSDFLSDKIIATRGQILTMEAVPKFMEGPCYANFVLDYFRQLPNGQMLIGGFRQESQSQDVGYENITDEATQNALHDFIKKYIPQCKDVKVSHRWAGIMGFSKDMQPVIGPVSGDPQTWVVGGFTGHGLGLAFMSGKVLAEALMEGKEVPDFVQSTRFD